MNLKSLVHWFYVRACNYNLFIPTEHDYDEETEDPILAVQHQKYATRLYVLLFIICMYILFYGTMMKPQARTAIITDLNPKKFSELYSEFGDILSCPCSTITTSYGTFVSNTIKFHPVCSSFFVSQQWIEALYLPNRSRYGVTDFRTTAASQFQLLSSLCSLFKDLTWKNKMRVLSSSNLQLAITFNNSDLVYEIIYTKV